MRTCLRTAPFMAAVLPLAAAPAQDRPQWRGPGRDGKVAGFTVPAAWPKELPRKWKVTVGTGDSTPALVGGRLYVFARQGEDEVPLCLDAADGKEPWKDKVQKQGDGFAARELWANADLACQFNTPALKEAVMLARIRIADTPTYAHPVVAGSRSP